MGVQKQMKKIKKEIKKRYPDYKVLVNVTHDENVLGVYETWQKNFEITASCAKTICIMNKFGYIYLMNRSDHCKTLVKGFDQLNYKRWVQVFLKGLYSSQSVQKAHRVLFARVPEIRYSARVVLKPSV